MRDKMTILGVNMAGRAHRRWLVGLTYLALLAFSIMVSTMDGPRPQMTAFSLVLVFTSVLVNGFIFGGYGGQGLIKPFATCTPRGRLARWHNDERERQRRDRMHFHAYRIVVALLILGYLLLLAPFQQPEASRIVMLAAVVLGFTLPQALLLWTEPDLVAERDDTHESGPLSLPI